MNKVSNMGCICIHYSLFTFSNLELHYSKDCKCFYCIILKVGMHDGLLEELVKFSFLAWIMVTQVWSLCVYSLSCSITTCVLFGRMLYQNLRGKKILGHDSMLGTVHVLKLWKIIFQKFYKNLFNIPHSFTYK